MKIIRYIGKTAITKIFNSKICIFFFVFLIYAWSFERPYLQFISEKGYHISWCIFPFCMTSYSILSFFYFGVIFINSDVPFMQQTNMYHVIRMGRKQWVLGQIGGILIRSVFLTVISIIVSVLPVIGHIEFSNNWGKVIYTLASSRHMEKFYMENDVEFIFPYEALQDFNPLELMGLVLLLCILILTFLGIAMFMLSLFGGKLWAVLGGFFIVFLLFFVENTPGYNRITIARFVPVYWLELALSSTPSSGYYRMPSVTYMLIFLILSILAISLIICRKINRIELNWENEDV